MADGGNGEILRRMWADPQQRQRMLGGRPDNWPPERIEELKSLYGKITIDALAARFGISRGAVQGKASRLGLTQTMGPRYRTDEEIRQRRRLRRMLACATKGKLVAPKVVKLKPNKRSAMLLANFTLSATATCQFIEGDPKVDPSKCGKPAIEGKPYCPEHHALCYMPYVPKAQKEAA